MVMEPLLQGPPPKGGVSSFRVRPIHPLVVEKGIWLVLRPGIRPVIFAR
jgi:hypothetical protein